MPNQPEINSEIETEINSEIETEINSIEITTEIKTGIHQDTQTECGYEYIAALELDNQSLRNQLFEARIFISNISLSEESFAENEALTHFYTGLPNYKMLKCIFNFISPHISSSGHNSTLTKFQRMMIVFLKLRLNLRMKDLAYRFGVSIATVSRVYKKLLYIMYLRLKHLIHWPDRAALQQTMPNSFHVSFGKSVVVIIDCFEVFIENPGNKLAKAQTWNCFNRKTRELTKSFYRLPAIITKQSAEIEKISRRKRQQWISNISRDDLKECAPIILCQLSRGQRQPPPATHMSVPPVCADQTRPAGHGG
uniref:Transposase Helix-turn-helix domain-containing protein n=1 Tax=Strigamia maritima TaxID=126957 RepID=T1IH88_STRMM